MTVKELWVQRTDFSEESFSHELSKEAAIQKFIAFPWEDEIARYTALAREKKDCCPPGIGVVSEDGSTLHIFATSPNVFHVSRVQKSAGWHSLAGPNSSETTGEVVSPREVPILISDFLRTGIPHGKAGSPSGTRNQTSRPAWSRVIHIVIFAIIIIAVVSLLFTRDLLRFFLLAVAVVLGLLGVDGILTGTAGWYISARRDKYPILFWSIVFLQIFFSLSFLVLGLLIALRGT